MSEIRSYGGIKYNCNLNFCPYQLLGKKGFNLNSNVEFDTVK